jgi:hypothetical protein
MGDLARRRAGVADDLAGAEALWLEANEALEAGA